MSDRAWTDNGLWHEPKSFHPASCGGCVADPSRWGKPHNKGENMNPTIVDHCEVFDSGGTLSLMVGGPGGYDLLYLNVVVPDESDPQPADRVVLNAGDANHQKIIDVIAAALTGESPEPNGATDADLVAAIANIQKARSRMPSLPPG